MRLLFAVTLLAALGCAGLHEHASEEAEDPRPTETVTVYADGLELFLEYPAFVVGLESPLVSHFTDARNPEGFVWVTEGKITATLTYAGGATESFVADKLLRNGIFKPVTKPTRAGRATLSFRLDGPVAGVVSAGEVEVFPTVEAAVAAAAPEQVGGESTVGYLKESQWKTLYATTPVERRSLRGSVRAVGELRPVAGQAAELVAPFAARVVTGGRVPHLGLAVRRGELLATLVPVDSGGDLSSRELDRAQADADLAQAQANAERAESLHPAVLSARERDAAVSALKVAKARSAAAETRLAAWKGTGSGTGYPLRAPLDGVIAQVDLKPGAIVQAGERLVSVVNGERLWLEARVFESDAARVVESPGAMFTVSGLDTPFLVDEAHGGRRVGVGGAIDPLTRTLPILFELANPGPLRPGMYAKVDLFTSEAVEALAVPAAAVIDDNGIPVVYVMDGGESFFKRRATLGVRDGDWIEVRAGVADGERVVSRGAYEIKLSTAAGAIPEHGHQH